MPFWDTVPQGSVWLGKTDGIRQMGVGKILNNISYESLISQIYKEIIKFNSKKTPI